MKTAVPITFGLMKTAVPITFGDSAQFADCYILTLADGTVVYLTGCDRRLVVSAPQSNGQLQSKYSGINQTPTFAATRIQRGGLSWTGGVKPGQLEITIGVNASDQLELGLDWRAAAQRGLLKWAQVRVWRAFGDDGGGPFVLLSDGGARAGFSVPLFIGYVASVVADRGSVKLTCYDPRVIANMMLPRYTFGAQCRWTLYNPGDGVGTPVVAGHGCPVNRNLYAVATTLAAGSTRGVLQVPPFTGPVPGPASPGWFTQGYVVGSRLNANQRGFIRSYVPAVQSWIATALADSPLAFYPCADAPGSHLLQDISGNNYNGNVNGAVEFGQTSLGGGFGLALGMPPPYNTAAWFNNPGNNQGGSAYVALPIPPPWQTPGYGGGITIEFVANVIQQGFGDYANGIYDTGPGQQYSLQVLVGLRRDAGLGRTERLGRGMDAGQPVRGRRQRTERRRLSRHRRVPLAASRRRLHQRDPRRLDDGRRQGHHRMGSVD